MDWKNKDISPANMLLIGAALAIAAMALAWAAAGWKVSPDAGEVQVHVKKLGAPKLQE